MFTVKKSTFLAERPRVLVIVVTHRGREVALDVSASRGLYWWKCWKIDYFSSSERGNTEEKKLQMHLAMLQGVCGQLH